MGKKRVTIIGDFEAEEKLRQQKALERQQKKLREGKKLSKAEIQATELAKQKNTNINIDSNDHDDPITAMRLEMAKIKQEKEKSNTADQSLKQKSTKTKITHKRSKKYLSKKSSTPRTQSFKIHEAIEQILNISYTKFTGTIELHINLKKKNNFSNLNFNLPHSTGKSKKAVSFNDQILKELDNNKTDFDILFATPDQMKTLVKYAKLLGPKGLMPNPKNGTVVPDTDQALKNFKPNSITIKKEAKAPIIHTIIGKTNMHSDNLIENFDTIMKSVEYKNVSSVYLSSTMSPVIKLDINKQGK